MPGLAHRHTLYIRCRPAELWAALTEGEQTQHWFLGTVVESSFALGEPVRYLAHRRDDSDSQAEPAEPGLHGRDVEAIHGTIRAVEPQRRLVYEFRFCDLDEPASELEWTISEPTHAPGVVRVDVEHRGFVADSESWARTSVGWPLILSGLKTWLETSSPLIVPLGPLESA